MTELDFLKAFEFMQSSVHSTAISKGFWDHYVDELEPLIIVEKLALIHSEISEALEAVRNSHDGIGNLAEELADAIIRIMDLAAFFNLDIAKALVEKAEKNKERPYRHGKNF